MLEATDAAHISPIFHSESHCVHLLALQHPEYRDSELSLTLYSTAEPDPLSACSIIWANNLGFRIDRVVFGASAEFIRNLWGWKAQKGAEFIFQETGDSPIVMESDSNKDECESLFCQAFLHQKKIGLKRPGETLSQSLADFCWVNPE